MDRAVWNEMIDDVGVDHVQLVVDPITVTSIDWLGGVLTALDGS